MSPVISFQTCFLFSDAIPSYNAQFGRGTGPVVLRYVYCRGTERRLVDCAAAYHVYSDCSHYYDGGVVCLAGEENSHDCYLPVICYFSQAVLKVKSDL